MPQSLAHVALIVRDYDEAIAWFTNKLGFTLVADEHQPEQDKRWCSSRRPERAKTPPPYSSPAPRRRSSRPSSARRRMAL
jgi:catechol 2,3-dioxygenase-like lactoylglutathione lyase family enzyme